MGFIMQVSINIQDDLYKKVVSSGMDMQTKFNEYLLTLFDKKEVYKNSGQFQEDRAYFHDALEEIESGKVESLSHNDVWEQIEKHTKAN
jgi:hypothetical protein